MNLQPQLIKTKIAAPVEVEDLRICMGFILNDEDVLIQGWCEGSLFFAVTDYVQAKEIMQLDIFNDLEGN